MLTKANPHHCSPVLFFIQSPIEVYADFGAIIQWEQCCEQMKKVLIVGRGLAPAVFDRTVSPKFAIMQIWSSLSLVRVQFKKTKRTEHIRQYTILVGLQGCATCYETVHRTVSPKFVFVKFGAACRWFESINSERKADTQKRIGFSLAPQVGLEPTTLRLTAACSTN